MNKLAVSLVVGALGATAALADDGNASTAANGQKGLFNLNTAETLCEGQWSFSSYYNKWDRRVQSDPYWLSFDPMWSDWDMDVERLSVAVGYGVTDRFEVSLMLPYLKYDAHSIMHGHDASIGILNGRLIDTGIIDAEGLGNLRLGAKYQVKRTDSYVFALTGFIDAPTGDEDESVVTGETGLGVGFAWSNERGWVVNAGYQVPGDSDFGDVSDEIHVGVGYARDINERLQWLSELSGILYTESDGSHDAADITSGARYRLNNPEWALNAGLRVDLSDTGFDYTPIGGVVGVSYAPRNKFWLKIDKPVAKGANGKEYPGTGTVQSADGRIDCGANCQAKYRCGDSSTLTAKADATSRFMGWSDACSGEQDQVTVTIECADKTCGATFIRQYDVKGEVGFKKHPDEGFIDGAGKLVMSHTGGPGSGSKDCATKDCKSVAERLDGGATITFEAKPEGKSTFEWSGDCKGKDAKITLSLDKDTSCGVTFIGPPPVKANLEALVRGSGKGQVTFDPKSRDGVAACSGDCTVRYIGAEPVKVAVTAVPGEKSRFAGWSGACGNGTEPTANVVMDVNKTCVAVFESTDEKMLKDITACASGKGLGKKDVADSTSCEPRAEGLLFAAGSNALGPEYWPTRKNHGTPKNKSLCEVAATLARCPEVNACIVGNNDDQGGLAQERAQAVVQFLGFQQRFPYFQGVDYSRFKVQNSCGTGPAAAGVGATVVLEKKN